MTVARAIPRYPSPGLLERSLDVLFPPTCAGCRRVGRWICDRCWQEITWIHPVRCDGCGHYWTASLCASCAGQQSSLDGLVAVAAFDGTAREAVHAFKFEGRHAMGSMLGKLLAASVPELSLTLVAPVPLHPARRRERGYDQAEILAHTVARTLDLSCAPKVLRRIRRTKQQATLGAGDRLRNVAGAFEADPMVEGADVLLVDDVTTTGATLESAASELVRQGANSVTGLVFAVALPASN